MFEIIWSNSAFRVIKKLPRSISKRIVGRIDALSEDPQNVDFKKLIGMPYFRLRVGDYRVIFNIDYQKKKITIIKVGHRKNVY